MVRFLCNDDRNVANDLGVFGTRAKIFCFMIKSHKTEMLCMVIIEHIIISELLSQSQTEVFGLDFRHLGETFRRDI